MDAVEQILLDASAGYQELDRYLQESGVRRLFLVCGASIEKIPAGEYFGMLFNRLGIEVVRFSDFHPNPDFKSVEAGIREFKSSACSIIVAAGGGSAIDVAKCIKLRCCAEDRNGNAPKLAAIPTTAGSGSEATRFAVIYREGRKQSVTDPRCIPSVVVFDPRALALLPLYHKKSAMLDALCHGIESYWSVNSTDESRTYSRSAIKMIIACMEGYVKGDADSAADMQRAAYLSGKAINITQTTAGHAMSYGLTSRYGVAHGHAAALCVAELWPYMLKHIEDCADPRGQAHLEHTMQELANAMDCDFPRQAAERIRRLLKELELDAPQLEGADIDGLADTVAPERLKNHPVMMNKTTIKRIYREILSLP